MTVALLTNIVSPHQLPLANEIVKHVGAGNYSYVYTESFHAERVAIGWGDGSAPNWCKPVAECREFLENADLVYCEERDLDLFERRLAAGRKTFYVSERWLKPIFTRFGFSLPGIFKLLSPRYFSMARRFVRFFGRSGFLYLPQGIHAARDMARLCGLMHGDLRCLFRAPKLEFEREPGGRMFLTQRRRDAEVEAREAKKYRLDKMRMWGYFVERSVGVKECVSDGVLKVLWVGRLLGLKRVDTIIRAVGELSRSSTPPLLHSPTPPLTLDIYGVGPEENRLKKLATSFGGAIRFHPPVPIVQVRELMRQHDVYVFSSNSFEGWGAVVSEALEEGMIVIGSQEAGACATMLPPSHQFHSGDWRVLAALLQKAAAGELLPTGIGTWTAAVAAERLLRLTQRHGDTEVLSTEKKTKGVSHAEGIHKTPLCL